MKYRLSTLLLTSLVVLVAISWGIERYQRIRLVKDSADGLVAAQWFASKIHDRYHTARKFHEYTQEQFLRFMELDAVKTIYLAWRYRDAYDNSPGGLEYSADEISEMLVEILDVNNKIKYFELLGDDLMEMEFGNNLEKRKEFEEHIDSLIGRVALNAGNDISRLKKVLMRSVKTR